MNIIDRNFYRLLRIGAFGTTETLEPLSVWKWNRLYQLSEMHDVAPIVYRGIEQSQNQFFVQMPEELLERWRKAAYHDEDNDNDMLIADHLTNPVLNHLLQNILDSEESGIETRTVLLQLLGIARFILNAGIPVKRLVELGITLRHSGKRVDYTMLKKWIGTLKMNEMVQFSSIMLVKLLHFTPEELPFMNPTDEGVMEKYIREMFKQKNSHAEEWYFSQGKNIFVHTSNSSAMLWHVRRSVKFLRYYPAETTTNFFTSFAHSLSHIEE